MNESGSKQTIVITKSMTASDVAAQLGCPAGEVILYLLRQGIVCTRNKILPENLVKELARHFGVAFEVKQEDSPIESLVEKSVSGESRAPIVVVIGHVDHGKTTLLDYIRKSRVAQREKGGITQHLGAYKVNTAQGEVVFLDTPGHEAFMLMRARGVKVADIAVLVVAADDGVMPQTVEAIKHAQEAKVPLVVALNKIDKVDSKRIQDVKNQLSRHGVMLEEWGGDVLCIPLSAKTGVGVDKLIETLPVFGALLELKATKEGPGVGYILESKIEKGRGAVSTVVLQHGTLKLGDHVIVGGVTGRVNAMVDAAGRPIDHVGPSDPAKVAGFDELAPVGEVLKVISLAEYKKLRSNKGQRLVSETIGAETREDVPNILLKVDTNSSKEALVLAIEKLAKQQQQEVNIIQVGIGVITESDVLFAAETHATIYGFCVKPEIHVQVFAKRHGVQIKSFFVIYHLLDDLKERLEKMRKPKLVEKKIGEAIVRKVFNIKGQVIAGCYVKTGRMVRGHKVVIMRDNQEIGHGIIQTLQREKRAIKEAAAGFECGFIVDGFNDFAENDRIECISEEMSSSPK